MLLLSGFVKALWSRAAETSKKKPVCGVGPIKSLSDDEKIYLLFCLRASLLHPRTSVIRIPKKLSLICVAALL